MRPEGAENVRVQCLAHSVPFFFKQGGAWGRDGVRRNKKANGRELAGRRVIRTCAAQMRYQESAQVCGVGAETNWFAPTGVHVTALRTSLALISGLGTTLTLMTSAALASDWLHPDRTSSSSVRTYYCGRIVDGMKCGGDDGVPITKTFKDGMGGWKTYDDNDKLLYTTERDPINGGLVNVDTAGNKWRTYRQGGVSISELPDGTKQECWDASGTGQLRCDLTKPTVPKATKK